MPSPFAPKENSAKEADIKRGSRRVSQIKPNILSQRAMVVLKREIDHLMDMSYQGKLDKAASEALTHYIKLLRDILKADATAAGSLDDEGLIKASRKATGRPFVSKAQSTT